MSVDHERSGIICYQIKSLREDDVIYYIIVSFGVCPTFFILIGKVLRGLYFKLRTQLCSIKKFQVKPG